LKNSNIKPFAWVFANLILFFFYESSFFYFSSFFYKEVLQFLRLFQIWLKKQESIIKKKLILKGLGFRISFDEKLNT
jgi:hypothetical protein